jgi:radical SAM protein with 4Fe4S-binding SPASM domain
MDSLDIQRLTAIEEKLVRWDFPPQIIIELTSLCNFACVHCNHKDMKRKRGFMDGQLFKSIIDEIVHTNPETEVWPTFYGEAFILGERLFELLRYASSTGARNLVLNSNGSLLHRRDWIDQILTSGLKRFILSLDGFTTETFESIRVGGKRDEIYSSVERLLRRKEELNQLYPVIQCQFSKMPENQHEFYQFKEYWESRGAEVKSRNMLSWTNSGPVVASNLDYDCNFRIACPWSNSTMAVHHNGDVVACAVDYEGNFKAGNVKDNSLAELWNGPLFERLRKIHYEHRWDDLPSLCKRCPDWQAVGASYHQNEANDSDKVKYARPFWFNQ